jgi:hypothetical protein
MRACFCEHHADPEQQLCKLNLTNSCWIRSSNLTLREACNSSVKGNEISKICTRHARMPVLLLFLSYSLHCCCMFDGVRAQATKQYKQQSNTSCAKRQLINTHTYIYVYICACLETARSCSLVLTAALAVSVTASYYSVYL